MSFLFTAPFGIVTDKPARRKRAPRKKTLAEVVEEQVSEMVPEDFATPEPELPDRRDLSTYADAHASAIKRCQHMDLEDVIHSSQQWFCVNCRRYVTPAEVRDARRR